MNLRDKILNAKDIKEELVEVVEWDAVILVKGMTGKERANFLNTSMKNDKMDFEAMYPSLVISSSYDPETGAKLFTYSDKDIINSKSSSAIEKLAKKALELSGLGEDATEKAKKQ